MTAATDHKQIFIDKLNQRAGEYADFNYGADGPEFAFTRYLAFCMREVMDEKDVEWVIDQMMSIEAPECRGNGGKNHEEPVRNGTRVRHASARSPAAIEPPKFRTAFAASKMNPYDLANPLDLENTDAYLRWRDHKLEQAITDSDELIVEIKDPRALTKAEHAASLERCLRSNMVIYATRADRR